MRYRRAVVASNLRNAFQGKSERELKAIEKKFYRHFCDTLAETLKILTIKESEIKKRMEIKNPELIEKYYRENRSIILYAAHQGNWEWLGFLPLFLPHQVTSFYQPLSNSYFRALMKTIRERFGTICIESNKGYRAIVQFKQQNMRTLNMIIGDQSPVKEHDKYWTVFLNQETAFLTGAERIAQRSNQVVIFSSYRKKSRGYYELEFTLMKENPEEGNNYEITDTYARLLEEVIQSSPELWLWSHRRWKLDKPASEGLSITIPAKREGIDH